MLFQGNVEHSVSEGTKLIARYIEGFTNDLGKIVEFKTDATSADQKNLFFSSTAVQPGEQFRFQLTETR